MPNLQNPTVCEPTLSRGGEKWVGRTNWIGTLALFYMKAFQGRGRRTDLGLCCVPPAPRVIWSARSPTICRQSQAAARRELERARWREGSLSAVPETAAEVGRGVAVLEA